MRKILPIGILYFFGASPKHVEILWYDLSKYGSFKNVSVQKVKPVHLLMGFHFLTFIIQRKKIPAFMVVMKNI